MKIEPAKDILLSNTDDEIVLLNQVTGVYYGLNTVAARFWELILQDNDFDVAIDIISQEYDVSSEQLNIDLLSLVNYLYEEKLLTVSDGLGGNTK